MPSSCIFLSTILVLICTMSAAEIIPMSRRIIWQPGVPGGIPNYPVGQNVVDHGAVGDGVTDDTQTFIDAIAAASEGEAVMVPEGTYLITSCLSIGKGVCLRGEGIDGSHLVFDLAGAAESSIEIITYARGDWVDVTAGYTKDSSTFQLADTSSFAVGDFAEIQQDNDPSVMYTDPEWNQTWAENSIGQMFRVTAVDSGSISVAPPLHLTLDGNFNPQVRRQGLVTGAGIEHLHLKRLDTGDANMIHIKNAAGCWIRDIHSEWAYRCHVSITSSLQCEVRDSWFHDAHDHGGGGHGYGVGCGFHTTDCLIENNIFVRLRHSMIIQLGANGNVYGYNYSREPQSEGAWTPCDISMHGHYPFMNLFEGNTLQEADISDYWGPCGPGNTIFRCRLEAEGIQLMDHSHQQNLVGNELTTSPNVVTIDGTVTDTLIHGNHENGSIQWDPVIADHNLPDSYYLSSKPGFFEDLTWPATGGDLVPDGGLIPAEIRWRELTGQTPPEVSLTGAVLQGTVSDNLACPVEVTVNGTAVPVAVTGITGAWTAEEVNVAGGPASIAVSCHDASGNPDSVTVSVSTP